MKSSGVNLARIVVCNLLFTNKENENLLLHNLKWPIAVSGSMAIATQDSNSSFHHF